jgi:hypothetical protein
MTALQVDRFDAADYRLAVRREWEGDDRAASRPV